MNITRFVFTAGLITALCTPLVGCKKDGETENPDGAEEGDQDPMEELKAVPADIQAEIDMVMQPIADLEQLMADIETAPERLEISMADLKGMVSASYENGSVEISADLDITAEARAELEAMLETASNIAAQLKAVPDTAVTASTNIVSHGARAVTLATKVSSKLTAKVKFAAGEEKAALEQQIQDVANIKAEVEGSIEDAKATVMSLPDKAVEVGANFTASLAAG